MKQKPCDMASPSKRGKPRILTRDQISERIKGMVERVNQLLCRDNSDDVLAILRHFKWSQLRIQEHFFENSEQLELQVGLRYSRKLKAKYPEIDQSKEGMNNNTC